MTTNTPEQLQQIRDDVEAELALDRALDDALDKILSPWRDVPTPRVLPAPPGPSVAVVGPPATASTSRPATVETPAAVEAVPAYNSWEPMNVDEILAGDFTRELPTLMPVGDHFMLYRGKTHSFHGESESGKSLLAQLEAIRLLNAGERVLYLDFESDAVSVVHRLLTFGADREQLRAGFVYLRPEVAHDMLAAEGAAFDRLTAEPFALAVIDGVTDSLGVYGASTKDNDEIAAWSRRLPNVLATRTGAAVVMIDHVTKSTDGRGRFAIGGQHKMNGLTGAAFTVSVKPPISPGRVGKIFVRVGKDRPGAVREHSSQKVDKDRTQLTAVVTIDSTGATPVVRWDPPGAVDEIDDETPAGPAGQPLHEEISRFLEEHGPSTTAAVLDGVKRNAYQVRTTLTDLVARSFVGLTEGPRGAKIYTSVRPFRSSVERGLEASRGVEAEVPFEI